MSARDIYYYIILQTPFVAVYSLTVYSFFHRVNILLSEISNNPVLNLSFNERIIARINR